MPCDAPSKRAKTETKQESKHEKQKQKKEKETEPQEEKTVYKCVGCQKLVGKDEGRNLGGSTVSGGVTTRFVVCNVCENTREQWEVLVQLPVPERGQFRTKMMDTIAKDIVLRVG